MVTLNGALIIIARLSKALVQMGETKEFWFCAAYNTVSLRSGHSFTGTPVSHIAAASKEGLHLFSVLIFEATHF